MSTPRLLALSTLTGSALLLAPPLHAQTTPRLLASTSRSFHTGDQDLAEAYRPYEVAVADFDGDGAPDVALAHYGNFIAPKVSWMRNAGDGTFERPQLLAASGDTMDVVAADLDGDGDVDLAFAQSSEGTTGQAVLVWLNDGRGGFGGEARFPTGAGPTGIAAGDIDGDGDIDLVTANNGFNAANVSVLVNDGAAGFATRRDLAAPGQKPRRVEVADLTGDGRPEIVASLSDGSPDFAVFTNDGRGGFGTPTLHSAGFTSATDGGVKLADLDRDGDADVLFGAMANGLVSSVALFRNQGGGQLGAPESLMTAMAFGTVYDFAVADVTGDGWPDILGTAQSSAYGWVLLPGDGRGGFWSAQVFRSGEMARAIAAADFDGDGDLDVAVVNSGSLTLTVHENENGSFAMPTRVTVPAFSAQSDVGDIEGDGDLDLVTTSGIIMVLTNDGLGGFTANQVVNLGGSLTSPRLRELDGDGRADLLFLRGSLQVAFADGFGGFGTPQAIALGGTARSIDTIDGDGDGDRDIVVAGALGGRGGFFYLANLGNGALATPVFHAASSTSVENHALVGDFDNDRRPDVLTASGADVRVWLGAGSGFFQPPLVSSLGIGGTNHVTVADLDGDGHLDVAASSYGSTFRGELLTIAFGYGDGDFGPPVHVYGMFSLQYGGTGGLDHLDVDGDGDIDLVAGCYGADDVEVFVNRGGRQFEGHHRYGVNGVVTGVRVGDFDRDGRPDVAVNVGTEPPIGGAIAFLRNVAGRLPLEDLGAGLAGTRGVPRLGALGDGVPGQPFQLVLRRTRPNAPLVYAIGAVAVHIPLFGGTLVPAPTLALPWSSDAAGNATLGFAWPGGIARRADLFAQAWVLDPAGPQQFAASNALRMTQL